MGQVMSTSWKDRFLNYIGGKDKTGYGQLLIKGLTKEEKNNLKKINKWKGI
tara:strand:- start:336 stop:488 length:153 start_codon:yes stop_codon:yes gene_type:complete